MIYNGAYQKVEPEEIQVEHDIPLRASIVVGL